MKNKLIILSILFSILWTSCGARKVQKSETKEETKVEQTSTEVKTEVTQTETETNVKVVTETKVDTEKNVVSEVVEVTPIDNTKQSLYKDAKGNTYDITNAKYRNVKTTDLSKENKVTKEELNALLKELENVKKDSELKNKIIAEQKKQLIDKQTEKESWFSWWWLLIILIVAYLSYRWYSNLKNDAIDYLE